MHLKKSYFQFLLLLIVLYNTCTMAQPAVPQLTQWVTDQTGTLSPEQINQLSRVLSVFQDSTSNQVVVLMIPTLDGYPIEDYAFSVAEKNKIGSKEHSNGILVLIAKNDRKARIEVGYGLEGPLPDATANYIIRKEMGPFFKDNDYYQGIAAGITAIIKATAGEYKMVKKREKKQKGIGIGAIIFALLFIFIIPRLSRRGIFYGGGIGGFGGGGFGGGGFGGGSSGGGGFGGFSGGGGGFGGGGSSGSW